MIRRYIPNIVYWPDIKHFDIDEWGEGVEHVAPKLIYRLDDLREYVGDDHPIYIHRAYDSESKKTHGEGLAVDYHIENMSLMDQYLVTERFNFSGIGVYPGWNKPGIHGDVRLKHARWGCHIIREKIQGVGGIEIRRHYMKLDRSFMLKVMMDGKWDE